MIHKKIGIGLAYVFNLFYFLIEKYGPKLLIISTNYIQ